MTAYRPYLSANFPSWPGRAASAALVGAVVASVVVVGPVVAQQSATEPRQLKADDKVNALLAAIREKHDVPGMIGAIINGDRIVAIGAAGVRKDGEPDRMQVGDVVHIGSCTKAMTATLIAGLVEQKKLKWDSTILSVFPDLKETIHADYAKVTLTDLLNHRAGLPRAAPWGKLGADKSPTEQRLEAIKLVLHDPPPTKPGTKFQYSNLGYVVAGRMAEQVTGSSWEDLMRKKLFEPLGMKSAGFGPPGTKGKIDQPWGHYVDKDGRHAAQIDNPAVLGPAGTVHCSLSDWAKFAVLHMRGDQGKARLLKADTFQLLHTPPGEGKYAFGFMVADTPPKGQAFWHGGSNRGWFAVITLYPESGLAVLVATNQGDPKANKAALEATQALARHNREASSDRKPEK
jgi:CubicO group peptidase (beta-lactamase class C family)